MTRLRALWTLLNWGLLWILGLWLYLVFRLLGVEPWRGLISAWLAAGNPEP